MAFWIVFAWGGRGGLVGDGWEEASGGENVGVEGYQERSKIMHKHMGRFKYI